MCERKTRKIRKGSHVKRLRQTRRMQRLQRLPSPPAAVVVAEPPPCAALPVDKSTQCRLILELALKTVTLLQKNTLIQQKLVALRKETSEFMSLVMSNPENKQRYLEHVRVYGPIKCATWNTQQTNYSPLKLQPKV